MTQSRIRGFLNTLLDGVKRVFSYPCVFENLDVEVQEEEENKSELVEYVHENGTEELAIETSEDAEEEIPFLLRTDLVDKFNSKDHHYLRKARFGQLLFSKYVPTGGNTAKIFLGSGAHGEVTAGDFNGQCVAIKSYYGIQDIWDPKIDQEAHYLNMMASSRLVPQLVGCVMGRDDVAPLQNPAMIMQCITNSATLEWCLQNHASLKLAQWLSICQQLLFGITIFHSKGIIINDLKPDNIMIQFRPRDPIYVKVYFIDLGLATGFDGVELSFPPDLQEGDYPYQAPEVKAGAPTSTKSDMFAIGQLLKAIVAELHCETSFVAPVVISLVLMCLRPDPSHRPDAWRAASLMHAACYPGETGPPTVDDLQEKIPYTMDHGWNWFCK